MAIQAKANTQFPALKPPRSNVLSGTDDIIDRWINSGRGCRKWRHKSACIELSRRGSCGDVGGLIERLYKKIDENWKNQKGTRVPSEKNWLLRNAGHFVEHNLSEEKGLEKKIAAFLSEDWFNQMPAASGLTGPDALKKASIDLVHRISIECYELIELKCKTNTPLYAAIEILLYGLLYIHARDHHIEMKYSLDELEVLSAKEIGLRVLAPTTYYDDYELDWFEKNLSNGIAMFVGSRFKMDFKFTAFPASFRCDRTGDKENLQAALEAVTPAFP